MTMPTEAQRCYGNCQGIVEHDNLDSTMSLLDYPGIIVTTYARDSIWNTDFGGPFKPLSDVEDVGVDSITIKGKKYQYSEAKLQDVLRLLEKPEGKIVISRLMSPVAGQEAFVKALTLKIRRQVEKMPNP